MRYVCDIGKLLPIFLLIVLAACVRATPENSADSVSEITPSLALDDHGCLADAVAHRRQYFESAAVTVTSVSPHIAENLIVADAIVHLDPPVRLDLLDPQGGLSEIIQALPPGRYESAELRVSSAEVVLRAHAGQGQGLTIKDQFIELNFLLPLSAPETPPGKWSVSACLDSLRVRNGEPTFDPPRIQVSTGVPVE